MNINWDSQSLMVLGVTGTVFLVMGIIMYYLPPKKINSWYGYRTINSMSSQERWDFAQRYSAIIMIKCGVFMSLLGLIVSISSLDKATDIIISTPSLLIVIGFMLFKNERAITKKFGKNQTQK